MGATTAITLTAQAVHAAVSTTGDVLFSRNATERRAPASLTKLATALVIRQFVDLRTEVIITHDDAVDRTESQVGLVAGDTLTVEQLLYAMLVRSGNDAARAAARVTGAKLAGIHPSAAAPAMATFVRAMNDLAAALDLQNTRFANPSGMDAPAHYASAQDLTALATVLLQDEVLRTIVRTPSYDILSVGPERHQYRTIRNTNQLLGEAGIVGIKTGTTDDAGSCLVVAKQLSDDTYVVTTVLGCENDGARYDDMRIVLEPQWVPLAATRYRGLRM